MYSWSSLASYDKDLVLGFTSAGIPIGCAGIFDIRISSKTHISHDSEATYYDHADRLSDYNFWDPDSHLTIIRLFFVKTETKIFVSNIYWTFFKTKYSNPPEYEITGAYSLIKHHMFTNVAFTDRPTLCRSTLPRDLVEIDCGSTMLFYVLFSTSSPSARYVPIHNNFSCTSIFREMYISFPRMLLLHIIFVFILFVHIKTINYICT